MDMQVELAQATVTRVLKAVANYAASKIPLSQAQALLSELVKVKTATPRIDSPADRRKWEQLTQEDLPRALRELESSLSEEDAQRLQPFLSFWTPGPRSSGQPGFEIPPGSGVAAMAATEPAVTSLSSNYLEFMTEKTVKFEFMTGKSGAAKEPDPSVREEQATDKSPADSRGDWMQNAFAKKPTSVNVVQVGQPMGGAKNFLQSIESSTTKQAPRSLRDIGLDKRP